MEGIFPSPATLVQFAQQNQGYCGITNPTDLRSIQESAFRGMSGTGSKVYTMDPLQAVLSNSQGKLPCHPFLYNLSKLELTTFLGSQLCTPPNKVNLVTRVYGMAEEEASDTRLIEKLHLDRHPLPSWILEARQASPYAQLNARAQHIGHILDNSERRRNRKTMVTMVDLAEIYTSIRTELDLTALS